MSERRNERIAFDVDTGRVLQILTSEIYDSPKAFLRENVQNAYDAILMRCTAEGLPIGERSIRVTVAPERLSVCDDGIGMTEEVLRENFWKAGSSGKKSDLAQRSGVIGTFGIGAMANFGVCVALRVESRNIESRATLISSAKRADLRIAQDCIDLVRIDDGREPGTIITADLDPEFPINDEDASEYLKQYVKFLPVPVYVNGKVVSLDRFDATLGRTAKGFEDITRRVISNGQMAGTLRTLINAQARVLVRITDITLNGNRIDGEGCFVQGGGRILGLRKLFGLSPIPVSSAYDFGGFVNLNILKPTAGREALSRDSIQFVANLVSLIEAEASKDIAGTAAADLNQQFQRYILSHGLISLAEKVNISVLPGRNRQVCLGDIPTFEPEKARLFYAGKDAMIQHRFAGEQTNLLHVSQVNPRRKLQLRFLREISSVDEVPENILVERLPQTQLTLEEAMFLVRLKGVLLDDYFIPDTDIAFASISHGVSLHIEPREGSLHISIARDMSSVKTVVETYRSAPEVFHGFVIDFVRQHVYPHIREQVPSSTRQGKDALLRRLKENEELFKYDLSDFGEAEELLADYLSGKTTLEQVIRTSAGRVGGQRQQVHIDEIGTVEEELPDILGADADGESPSEYEAAPPILRPELVSEMRVLTVRQRYSKLNGFQMFLSVSDRLARREGEFLRQPHTTKLMWGSHRVIYIFADSTGELTLYYDLKLMEPLETAKTGGAMFRTTTIVTRDRIFVPVPRELESAFRISSGAKEFFVRFDTIP